MADPERRSPVPTFRINVSPMGVDLEVYNDKPVPHADLIQSMMNAGACAAFGLKPSWNTEGGVEGIYRRTAIQFENWDEGRLGTINTLWEAMPYLKPREQEAIDKVLGYYEVFLTTMFGMPIRIEGQPYPPEVFLVKPELQTREAVWEKIMDTLANTGGGRFPKEVTTWLANCGEASRRYLRGLSDDEIQRFFVDPPGE